MKYIKGKPNRFVQQKYEVLKNKTLRNDFRKNKRINNIVRCACIILFFVQEAILGCMIPFIKASVDSSWLKVILIILTVICMIFIPALSVFPIEFHFEKKFPYKNLYCVRRALITKAMQPLIKGYGVGESFLITKCFDCSNQLFKNKDVIIFKHEERIRIINDLFGSPKDIGCYYFDFNELAVNYEYRNDKRVAVIRCENFEMVLGMRAKPYILKIIKEAK